MILRGAAMAMAFASLGLCIRSRLKSNSTTESLQNKRKFYPRVPLPARSSQMVLRTVDRVNVIVQRVKAFIKSDLNPSKPCFSTIFSFGLKTLLFNFDSGLMKASIFKWWNQADCIGATA